MEKLQIGQKLFYNGFGSKVGKQYQIVKFNKTRTEAVCHEILPNHTLDKNGFWLPIEYVNAENGDWLTLKTT